MAIKYYDGNSWRDVGGGGATLLWTNPSPKSNFAAQTVSVNLSPYPFVMIEYKRTASASGTFIQILQVGNSGVALMRVAGATQTFHSREASSSTSGVRFGAGYSNTTSGAANCIPVKIWGLAL